MEQRVPCRSQGQLRMYPNHQPGLPLPLDLLNLSHSLIQFPGENQLNWMGSREQGLELEESGPDGGFDGGFLTHGKVNTTGHNIQPK